ncbi:MAG: hypothetical protein IH859_04160 [Chloroflexi bacterium]|nr:hypothetical protein [Chloroflexota bacterium]
MPFTVQVALIHQEDLLETRPLPALGGGPSFLLGLKRRAPGQRFPPEGAKTKGRRDSAGEVVVEENIDV